MIQVIERFHKILKTVAERDGELVRTGELAQLLDISSPATSNILRTMITLGYLERVVDHKGVRLGPVLLQLTGHHGDINKRLMELAQPFLQKLMESIGELVVLVVESSGRRLELLTLEAKSPIQINTDALPDEKGLLRTATGCLLAAHMDSDRLEELCRDDGHRFGENVEEALVCCQKIREQGYFIIEPHEPSDEDLAHGSVTFAYPILEGEKVIAAIGCRVPLFRFRGERKKEMLAQTKASAKAISECLTH